MIPQTFTDWKNCIVNDCKIKLTMEYAEQRLSIYQNTDNEETKKFISLYGSQHHSNIINWFNKVIND